MTPWEWRTGGLAGVDGNAARDCASKPPILSFEQSSPYRHGLLSGSPPAQFIRNGCDGHLRKRLTPVRIRANDKIDRKTRVAIRIVVTLMGSTAFTTLESTEK